MQSADWEPGMETMDKSVLFDLYKISIDEYRFQVQYNWERNRFYLLLSSGVVSVAASILKVQGSGILLLPLFVIGVLVGWTGYSTLKKGHEYYRRTVWKMSQLASQLGIPSEELPISTTAGQRESKMSADSSAFIDRPFRIGTINYALACLFVLAMGANLLGACLVLFGGYLQRTLEAT
jgi:hypothetical protein